MIKIDVQNIPNQMFSITLDNENYRVMIKTIQSLSFMSVWKNEDILFYNQLCVPNSFVNPYRYVSDSGKFYFKSMDNEYPNYRSFGNTQFLYFLSKEEVEKYEKA